MKCAKNTIETAWWEIDESLFFSPCCKSEEVAQLPQIELSDAPCADTWAHPAPPRAAAPRHTTLTPFPRRMCLQAGGKLPCTAKTCLASESKNAGTHEAKTHTRTCPRHQQTAIASPSTTRGARECHYFACPGWVCFYRDKVPSIPLNDLLCVSSFCMM